jgi:DNA polymerase III gamma/tau subunit
MPLSSLNANHILLEELARELRTRPSHCYLLCGPRGAGKMLGAHALALGLLCERSGGENFCCTLADCPARAARVASGRSARRERCACCAACVQVALGVHPDCYVIDRQPGRFEVSIEQVRALISRLGAKAVRARAPIAIIGDADTLSPPAQHALLKTLEEPPVGAVLFVIAHNERALLATVRSRLRLARFKLLPPEQRAAVRPELADALDATAAPEADSAFAPAERFFEALASPHGIDAAAARRMAEEFFRDREQAASNFEWLALRFEEMLRFKLLGDDFAGLEAKTAAAMKKIATATDLETVLTGLDYALRALSAIRAMANPALQAENWWLTLGEAAREQAANTRTQE